MINQKYYISKRQELWCIYWWKIIWPTHPKWGTSGYPVYGWYDKICYDYNQSEDNTIYIYIQMKYKLQWNIK